MNDMITLVSHSPWYSADRTEFATATAFDSLDLGIDRILDFSVGMDKISLATTTFTQLRPNAHGKLRKLDFEIVTSNRLVQGSSAEIVYNSSNGNLYYNPNNEAIGFGDGGLFAKLVNTPDNLSNRDFAIVE